MNFLCSRLALWGFICFLTLLLFIWAFGGWFQGIQAGLIIPYKGTEEPGYSLFSGNLENYSFARLINKDGNTIHEWRTTNPEFRGWRTVELRPQGTLRVLIDESYNRWNSKVFELDRQNRIRWSVPVKNAHHSFTSLKNGGFIVLSYYKSGPNSRLSVAQSLKNDILVEYDRSGQQRWVWRLRDHVDQLIEHGASLPSQKRNWAHVNSVNVIPTNSLKDARFREGNLVVGFRDLNLIGIIDPTINKIVWSWTGTNEHYHEALMTEQGTLLVFENGKNRHTSRVIEIDPVEKKIVWQYPKKPNKSFWSLRNGFAQRLRNGNTLIAQSQFGKVFEIDRHGKIIWQFNHPNVTKLPFHIRRRLARNAGNPQRDLGKSMAYRFVFNRVIRYQSSFFASEYNRIPSVRESSNRHK